MTYVSAEVGHGGTFMRSDIAVSYFDDEDGNLVKQSPLPKMMILDSDFVIGIAGLDPVGGIVNLLAMWDGCSGYHDLMQAIDEDGDTRREYLLLTIEREVFRFREGEWSSPKTFGWIGDDRAKRLHDPDPFDFNISEEDEATRQDHAEWARQNGFDEESIEFVLSGRAAAEIGPEIAQLNAMRRSGPEVSAFMIEARLVGEQFKFARQSIVRVFGSPVLTNEAQVLAALFGNGMSVSHYTYSANGLLPAALTIEFLGARVTFLPCRNLGYSHRLEFLDPEDQRQLAWV